VSDTSQCDCAMMMSSVSEGNAPNSVTWIALTVIDDAVALLLTICSLSTTVAIPGMTIVVFGAGDEATVTPLTTAFTSVVEPVEPVAVEVHSLETVVAVTTFAPTTGFATAAVLCELPPTVPTPLPCVVTVSTPVVRTPGRFTLASVADKGPPPAAGSVTAGVGPTEAGPVTRAPKALPLSAETVAAARAEERAWALPTNPRTSPAETSTTRAAKPVSDVRGVVSWSRPAT